MLSIFFIALTYIALAGLALTYVPTRRVGGLVFWRIGRLGGSVYVARG
jgi:hypothetical protein